MSNQHYLRVELIDDVLLVLLQDRLGNMSDLNISQEFDEVRTLRRTIGLTKAVIDFGQVQLFGSTLLELIRVLWTDLTAAGGHLLLCNVSAFGREVLEISKFDQIWTVVETRTQALASMSTTQFPENWPDHLRSLLAAFDAGPRLLQDALNDFSPIQLRTPSPPGAWSVLQIVCHIADFELIYADRMKRVIAEEQPTLFGGDPDLFAAKLAYPQRNLTEELDVISSVRRQISRFLKTLQPGAFERTGLHSVDGPLTLTRLLERIAGHIPHHVQFINGKRDVMSKISS